MIRLDKIKATAHLVSFTFATDLENGRVVALGDLQADGEAYTAKAPADVAKDIMVLHASVPMNYNEAELEEDFKLKAGSKGRGYILESGDIFTITDDNFAAAPVLNDIVEPAVGDTKLAKTEAPATKLAGKVIAKDMLNGIKASVVQVL